VRKGHRVALAAANGPALIVAFLAQGDFPVKLGMARKKPDVLCEAHSPAARLLAGTESA
jgi:hypothetical protein